MGARRTGVPTDSPSSGMRHSANPSAPTAGSEGADACGAPFTTSRATDSTWEPESFL